MAERKRKELTVLEKLEIIDALRGNKCTRKDIVNQFKCNTSTITRILGKEEQLRKSSNVKAMRIRAGCHEKVNVAISRWYHEMRKQNAFINGPIIKEQALKFAKMLNITTFEASNGWLWRWQKKENVVFKTLHEERNNAKSSKEKSLPWNLEGPQVSQSDNSAILDDNFLNSSSQLDLKIIEEITSPDKDIPIEMNTEDEVEVEVNDESDTVASSEEANKALDTLLRYLFVNGIGAMSRSDIGEHFLNTSYKNATEASLHHDFVQRSSTDFEPSDTAEEQDEVPTRKISDQILKSHDFRDQYSVYGEHIAYRLRSCKQDDYDIYVAQHNIDDILFKLSMGAYKQVNPRENGSPSYNEPQTPTESAVSADSFSETTQLVPKQEPDL